MVTDEQKRYLESLAREIVAQAKGNLSEKKGSTKLGNTIGYNLETSKDYIIVNFEMADYGTFVDKGVKGKGGTINGGKYDGSWGGRRYYKTYQGKRKDSPYAYGKSKDGGLTDALTKWIAKKGIKGRDDKGRFMKRSTLAMLMARAIYIRGIHGISFFQKAIGDGIKGLKDGYAVAFKKDFLDTTFAAIKK